MRRRVVLLLVSVAPGRAGRPTFVPRLCEKVTAREENPQAPAAGCLRGELFLFKQEVAG